MIGDSLMTKAQRAERNKLCEDIVLAHQLSGKPVEEIAQALFLALPQDHWLLREVWARHSFSQQLKHQMELTRYENSRFRKAHV